MHLRLALDANLLHARHQPFINKALKALFGLPNVEYVRSLRIEDCDVEDESLGHLALPADSFFHTSSVGN